jgi:hypothetical protein
LPRKAAPAPSHPDATPAARPKRHRRLRRLTLALAERHEALWLRLTALHGQLATLASRRPGEPLPEATRIVAEALLADAAVFWDGGDILPALAPVAGGALTQLGQALAGLESYELAHSGWDERQKCFAWLIRAELVPIRRLRPQVLPVDKAGETREMLELQKQIERRINALTKGLPDPDDGPPRARAYAPRRPLSQTYPRPSGLD